MASVATGLGESRSARLAIGAVALVLVTLVARPESRPHPVVGTSEQLRAILIASTWRELAQVRDCARPALREPGHDEDATALLRLFVADDSTIAACLRQVGALHEEIDPPCKSTPCRPTPLASIKPHPELEAPCATLHETIDHVAHARAACSPLTFDLVDAWNGLYLTSVPRAVRLQVAPMAQRGELTAAARHIIDAMRLADDLARDGSLVATMLGIAFTGQLAETLQELLADPRMDTTVASAIASDLDKLRATAPGFVPMMRQENLWLLSHLEYADAVTGDRAQDQALMILDRARLMAVIERACGGGASPQACFARLWAMPSNKMWAHFARRLARRDSVLYMTSMQAAPTAITR